MENSIFNLLPFDPAILILGLFLIVIILLIAALVALANTNKRMEELNVRYEGFMSGRNAESLEERIMAALTEIERLNKVQKMQRAEMGKMDHRVKKSYQKVGLIKYNGFAGMGGMASFVLTMLDESDNGFILNVIHSREGCYPYIKEVRDGKSEVALGQEEMHSLEMALRSL